MPIRLRSAAPDSRSLPRSARSRATISFWAVRRCDRASRPRTAIHDTARARSSTDTVTPSTGNRARLDSRRNRPGGGGWLASAAWVGCTVTAGAAPTAPTAATAATAATASARRRPWPPPSRAGTPALWQPSASSWIHSVITADGGCTDTHHVCWLLCVVSLVLLSPVLLVHLSAPARVRQLLRLITCGYGWLRVVVSSSGRRGVRGRARLVAGAVLLVRGRDDLGGHGGVADLLDLLGRLHRDPREYPVQP